MISVRTLIAGGVVLLSACGGQEEPVAPALGGAQDIFDRSCTLIGCHTGANPAAEMSLARGEALASLVDRPTISYCPGGVRVVPGDPDASCLWELLNADTMPLEGALLSDGDKSVVREWILEGAPP